MVEFSVIIPIYNSEKSIRKCLDSLVNQSFGDFEVIMIDDGSSDESYSICTSYTTLDSRFKLIKQKNQGPSSARNAGLKMAKGKYITFVDSDDYVSSEYLNCLHMTFNETASDVVFFGFYIIDSQSGTSKAYIPSAFTGDMLRDVYELSKKDMFGYTWIKAFCRNTIAHTLFPEDMDLFEDEIFTCKALRFCNKIGVVQSPIYFYSVDATQALTKKLHSNYCQLRDAVYNAWKSLLNDNTFTDEILAWQARKAISVCKYYGFEKNVNVKEYFLQLSQCSFFKEYSNNNMLDSCISKRRIHIIALMRSAYRAKIFFIDLRKKRR